MNEQIITMLKYLLRAYDGIKKLIGQSKNRLSAINPEADYKHQDEIVVMESLKGKMSRRIAKELEFWPIWNRWANNIPGIGPFIAGNLILLYYYRFVPICKKCGVDLVEFKCPECGGESKGQGMLKLRIELKDFPNISKWHSYMGEANDPETGRMVQMKKGQACTWSPRGRNISWQIGMSIEKCPDGHPYKDFYNQKKLELARKNKLLKPWQIRNGGQRRVRKLFLSHFWHVARELEGKSTDGPWIIEHGPSGHTIIPPYFWDSPNIH